MLNPKNLQPYPLCRFTKTLTVDTKQDTVWLQAAASFSSKKGLLQHFVIVLLRLLIYKSVVKRKNCVHWLIDSCDHWSFRKISWVHLERTSFRKWNKVIFCRYRKDILKECEANWLLLPHTISCGYEKHPRTGSPNTLSPAYLHLLTKAL